MTHMERARQIATENFIRSGGKMTQQEFQHEVAKNMNPHICEDHPMEVHGHTQCSVCGRMIMSCCEGSGDMSCLPTETRKESKDNDKSNQ